MLYGLCQHISARGFYDGLHRYIAPQLRLGEIAMKSPGPPKAGFPPFARLPELQRKVLLTGLTAFFILAAATTLLLAFMVYQPEITA